jgi:hypothetical protein
LQYPWIGVATGGTQTAQGGTAGHPGIVRVVSGSNAGQGWSWMTGFSAFMLQGGEETEAVWKMVTAASSLVRTGFFDNSVTAQPTDGCWLEISGTTASGYCRAGGAASQTGTSYQITQGSWYRSYVEMSKPTGGTATFTLYDTAGSSLWSSIVTAQMPTAVANLTGHGFAAFNASALATSVVDLDYLRLTLNGSQAR